MCTRQAQVVSIMVGVLEVLSFVHQQNVIHRDIKPENIIRRQQDQQLVLIDFGVVKHLNTELELLSTNQNLTVGIGTPGYMPSEQAQGEPKLASDIYAVGMIGIQALTGIAPHQLLKNADLEVIWEEYTSDVPPELITVINQMVRYDFRQRYGSADEALRALRQCQQDCGLLPLAPSQITNPDLATVVIPSDVVNGGTSPQQSQAQPTGHDSRDALTSNNSPTVPQSSNHINDAAAPVYTPRDLSHIIPTFVKPERQRASYWQWWLGVGIVGTLFFGGIVFMGLSNQVAPPKNALAGSPSSNGTNAPSPRANYPNYQRVKTLLSHSEPVYGVRISPNGQWLASGSGDRTAIIWDRITQKQKYTLKGHTDRIYDLDFSPNGQLLATGSSDRTIKIWQVSTGKLLHTFTGHKDRIYTVLFQDDNKLFSSSADGTVRQWNLNSKQTTKTINVGTSVYDIAFSKDNKLLATANKDGEIIIWNLETTKAVQRLGNKNSPVRCIDISPNNKWVVTGTEDGLIHLWSLQTEEHYVMRGHTRTVHTILFSPDGQMIASGSEDATIRLWDVSQRQVFQTLTEHSSGVSSIAFSQNGDWLISGGFDNRVILWKRTNPRQ
ncbi:MAG: WD40 repeat domain-containing serine/threonine-protein kinase [Pseudanabaena sp. ELA607]